MSGEKRHRRGSRHMGDCHGRRKHGPLPYIDEDPYSIDAPCPTFSSTGLAEPTNFGPLGLHAGQGKGSLERLGRRWGSEGRWTCAGYIIQGVFIISTFGQGMSITEHVQGWVEGL